MLFLNTENLFAEEHTFQQLMDSTKFYQEQQDLQAALEWAFRAEAKAKEQFGEMDTNYVEALQLIEQCYYYKGNAEKAIEYCEKTKPIIKEIRGVESTEYAEVLAHLGFLYNAVARYSEAEPLYKEALEMRRRLFKGDHPDLAKSINNMAEFYNGRGRYAEAEPLFREALEMSRRLFKGDHPDLARSINNMAASYNNRGNYTEAETLFREALEMYRRLFKGDHPHLAKSINNMAEFYNGRGRYAEAEPLFREALEMSRRLFKGDHPDLARSINNMAASYNNRGNYTEAEPLYKEALEMYRRLFKGDHPHLATSINNMALFYNARGNYTEAEPLYKEALEMRRRLFKGDHPDLANSINSMANFYNGRGRYAEAEPLFREALEMSRRLFKGDHPDLANSINSMAYFYNGRGRYAEAEPLFREALEMYRRLFKGDHPHLATSINNMAAFYDERGNYTGAEPLFREALEMYRRLFKGDHPHLATSINNMAYFYHGRGRYTEAEPLYKEALEMYRRLFKGDHPDLATSINNMAWFYDGQSRFSDAEPLYLEALQIYTKVLENYFPSLSEKEKQQFWNTMSGKFEGFNNFAIKRSNENPSILSKMYDNQLLTKGLLFNSAVKIKTRIGNSGDTSLIKIYNRWKDTRELLVKLYKKSESELKNEKINRDSIEQYANSLEKEISLKSEDYKQSYEKKKVNWKAIQTLLKPDEAAVEVIRVRYYDKLRSIDSIYYAFLIVSDQTEENPELVLLEDGKKLEGEYYNSYREAIKNRREDLLSYNRYWSKLGEKLKGFRKIYFSADGVYNKINPSTLMMPDGKYLLDIQDIQQINSTKDILLGFYMKKEESNMYNSAVLVGNPNFSLSEEQVKKLNNSIRGEATEERAIERTTIERGITLTRLPGTEKEIKEIEKFLRSKKWEVKSYLDDMAVKSAVKSANSPRVLHIATHGLFSEDIERGGKEIFGFEEMKLTENPLLRSGLFFSGAENYIKKSGSINLEEDSGILTAYEAMNLNLDRTELVVLSACETGLGDIKNGEGVFGLRRAFQQAGAKSLIMSLWTVSDEATQELMSKFYRNWVEGMSKRESFNKAQQEIRKKYPAPYFWGAFVMVGE